MARDFKVRPTVNGVNVALAGEGTLPTITVVEIDLGSNPVVAGSFQVTGLSGLTVNKPVMIQQAVGPYTNKGTLADEAEMDQLQVTGYVLDAATLQCYWTSIYPVMGNIKFNYWIGA